MKTVHVFLLPMTILFTSNILQGQNTYNQNKIKNIYNVLQNIKARSNDIAVLIPSIKWKDKKISRGVNERSAISFDAIMKNEWSSIEFENLYLHIVEKQGSSNRDNQRAVPSECEYICTRFKHS